MRDSSPIQTTLHGLDISPDAKSVIQHHLNQIPARMRFLSLVFKLVGAASLFLGASLAYAPFAVLGMKAISDPSAVALIVIGGGAIAVGIVLFAFSRSLLPRQ